MRYQSTLELEPEQRTPSRAHEYWDMFARGYVDRPRSTEDTEIDRLLARFTEAERDFDEPEISPETINEARNLIASCRAVAQAENARWSYPSVGTTHPNALALQWVSPQRTLIVIVDPRLEGIHRVIVKVGLSPAKPSYARAGQTKNGLSTSPAAYFSQAN